MFQANQQTYLSFDHDNAVDITIEFLHSLNQSGLPPLKNWRTYNSFEKFKCTEIMQRNMIEPKILSGSFQGADVFIPRIPMITNDYPFEFKRVQFPIKLCFAITINKTQGMTLKVTGLDLTTPCFTHGQFYVDCSRISSANNLFVYAPQNKIQNILFIAKYYGTLFKYFHIYFYQIKYIFFSM